MVLLIKCLLVVDEVEPLIRYRQVEVVQAIKCLLVEVVVRVVQVIKS